MLYFGDLLMAAHTIPAQSCWESKAFMVNLLVPRVICNQTAQKAIIRLPLLPSVHVKNTTTEHSCMSASSQCLFT